jgi:hypothetical protein
LLKSPMTDDSLEPAGAEDLLKGRWWVAEAEWLPSSLASES